MITTHINRSAELRVARIIALVIAMVGMLPVLLYAWRLLPVVRGWEADDIARNIVNGAGFSFSSQSRWLWDKWNATSGETYPTAWVDPVFTYLLAGAHALFTQYAYLAIYVLVLAWITSIFFCVYRLATRFGNEWTGVIAVALLAMHFMLLRSFFADISNSALAASVMTATVLVAVRYFEQPTHRRLAAMGLAMGFLVLTCPAAQYFVAATTLAVAWLHRRDVPRALSHGVSIALLAALVISPWTVRNYHVFGEFVLVRNGAGQIAWDGTS